MYYVTPAEGELFKRFSPELQRHNLENRERRTAEYLDFAGKMREYSKSDKPSTSCFFFDQSSFPFFVKRPMQDLARFPLLWGFFSLVR